MDGYHTEPIALNTHRPHHPHRPHRQPTAPQVPHIATRANGASRSLTGRSLLPKDKGLHHNRKASKTAQRAS